MSNTNAELVKLEILTLVDRYVELSFSENNQFIPGSTIVPPSGKTIDSAEIKNMVEASLDGWLTSGRFNKIFQERISKFIGVKHLLR